MVFVCQNSTKTIRKIFFRNAMYVIMNGMQDLTESKVELGVLNADYLGEKKK